MEDSVSDDFSEGSETAELIESAASFGTLRLFAHLAGRGALCLETKVVRRHGPVCPKPLRRHGSCYSSARSVMGSELSRTRARNSQFLALRCLRFTANYAW